MKKRFLKTALLLLLVCTLFGCMGAVCAADDGGEVPLPENGESLSSGTYYLEQDITITESFVIPEGQTVSIRTNEHTITCDGCRAFDVSSGAELSLIGNRRGDEIDTIINGSAEEGGGIRNAGTVQLTNVCLRNCKATGNGGGILNNGSLILKDTSTWECSSGGNGGAIWSSGSLTLEDSFIRKCSSDKNGGAIYLSAGSSNINDGSFGESEAIEGGAFYFAEGTTNVIKSASIWGNNGVEIGGGVYCKGSMNLDACDITHNISRMGSAIFSMSENCILNNVVAEKNRGESGAVLNAGKLTLKGSTRIIGNFGYYGSYGSNVQTNLAMLDDSIFTVDDDFTGKVGVSHPVDSKSGAAVREYAEEDPRGKHVIYLDLPEGYVYVSEVQCALLTKMTGDPEWVRRYDEHFFLDVDGYGLYDIADEESNDGGRLLIIARGRTGIGTPSKSVTASVFSDPTQATLIIAGGAVVLLEAAAIVVLAQKLKKAKKSKEA